MQRRVLLADDHTLLLGAFEKLLEHEYTVVGAVSDGRALLSAAAELEPDVIVLDIAMPLLNGLDAARQLKMTMPTGGVPLIWSLRLRSRTSCWRYSRIQSKGAFILPPVIMKACSKDPNHGRTRRCLAAMRWPRWLYTDSECYWGIASIFKPLRKRCNR